MCVCFSYFLSGTHCVERIYFNLKGSKLATASPARGQTPPPMPRGPTQCQGLIGWQCNHGDYITNGVPVWPLWLVTLGGAGQKGEGGEWELPEWAPCPPTSKGPHFNIMTPFQYSINPLHAEFFRRIININLHFISFLNTDMTQVVEILPQVRKGPTLTLTLKTETFSNSVSWAMNQNFTEILNPTVQLTII